MAAEKTFSRINAGESMLFLGRLTCCVQLRFGVLRAFAPGVLHSAMAPFGPLYSLRTTPPHQRGSNQRW